MLNEFISNEIVNALKAFKKRELSVKDVYRFQKCLLLFCFLQTGGQRREVIVNFAVDVSYFINCIIPSTDTWQNLALIENHVVHFTLDEKVQKRKTDRLTLPETVGQLLRIWIEDFRPKLVNKDSHVLAVFVDKDGAPLCKFSMT